MSIENMMKPKPLDYYADLTAGGKVEMDLKQDEACVALKVHDHGVDVLDEHEKLVLYRLIGKLKDQIWP